MIVQKHLLIKGIDSPISISDYIPKTIVIENSSLFYEICKELSIGQNDSACIKFFVEDKETPFSEFIDYNYDLFLLDFNCKKNQNALYKQLTSLFKTDESNIANKTQEIIEEFKTLLLDYDLQIDMNDSIASADYLKLLNVRIKETYSNFLERIIQYMEVVQTLRNTDTFIFANLNCFMSELEMEQLMLECCYKHINVVFLERFLLRKRNETEKILLVDKDLCFLE